MILWLLLQISRSLLRFKFTRDKVERRFGWGPALDHIDCHVERLQYDVRIDVKRVPGEPTNHNFCFQNFNTSTALTIIV